MTFSDLLIEIGVEELPPKAMQPLARVFAERLDANLSAAGIDKGQADVFATPRRIAVRLHETADQSAAETIEKFGPTVAIAYDDNGQPTKAGEGFARSVGTTIDTLTVEDSDKGPRLVYHGTAAGQPLSALLQPAVDSALRDLPIPKRMRWGNSEAAFVRPVHWVVALHGTQVMPLTVFDVAADRMTYGHRFHHPQAIELNDPADYAARLRSPGYVVADSAERRTSVIEHVKTAARSLDGQALISDDLVDEVVALVEWPQGIAGRFDSKYLQLPREVLIATLEGHQRYFPVENNDRRLIAGFVTVANIESRDPAQVVSGNERVVRPRLADALFFWEQDRRQGLAAQVPKLARVSFQQSLGSLADKSERIGRIASALVAATGAERSHVVRAAELAKADLTTEMVDEFPELQGLMGQYYAADQDEPSEVAQAIGEQYQPASSGAPIAQSAAGRCIALGDRLDTLAGIFAIDKRPSGDKDPFALRRAALGVLRTLIEGRIAIDLRGLLDQALSYQPVAPAPKSREALWMFHMERLRGYYQDRGLSTAQFESIVTLDITDMVDFDQRIQAVREFTKLETAEIVCAAHKRIRNILKRNANALPDTAVDPSTLSETAEKELHTQLESQTRAIETAAKHGDYTTSLSALAPLAAPLDRFFDEVMVMADDLEQRRNRLALLMTIDRLCRQVADISCLSVEAV